MMVSHAGGKRFSGPLRATALVVVFFFAWTLGGLAGLAQAAKLSEAQTTASAPFREQAPEERLETLLAEVEAELTLPVVVLKTLRQQLQAKQGELEALNAEIRQQFAKTEKRLKDANLPDQILERHYRFVKHYDDNLAELKGNIERIEKAKDKAEAEKEIEKIKEHLERTKAPSRHQPLDPNNLPHRQPKVQKREPRLKKEEFERDIEKDNHAWRNQKRIMVASAGSLAGLLAPDDLAETIEVQFTPEITAKAQELGNNPVKIYEWVRNSIEFVPTWGSIQGAQMTLETRQGNAFDTASLLIALLRASGIQARYVTGTIELPIDKVMNWAGDFTDPLAALDFMSSGGIPTKGLVAGGKIAAARLEHVWVEALIDYIPSRGAKHKEGEGDTWISLDPSFKQYDYTQGIDIQSAVPFDSQSFLDQIQATATINEADGYATGVNSLLVQQTMQDYQVQVQNFIEQNYPDATVGDVLGKKELIKQKFPFLLGTLPYRTAVKGATFAAIPDSLRHRLAFKVENEAVNISYFDPDAPPASDTSLRLTKSLPELAGKKITLSYSPATAQDETVLAAYLPKPHADGTPIQPSELPSSLPAYLINIKPELRMDGQVVATGAPVGLGGTNIFTMTFSDPSYGSSQVVNYIDAGVYQAIGLNLGRISQKRLTDIEAKLEATRTKLQNQEFTNLNKDELVGDLLNTIAIFYLSELGTKNYIAAKTMGVNAMVLPSETIFATKLKVLTLWGIPRIVQSGGLNMDADYLIQVAKSRDGNSDAVRQYMLSSGTTSSALEHEVPEKLLSTPDNTVEGISTAKALKFANDQGIPVYTVDQSNIATILPHLQVDQQVKFDIQNAVNAGKVVTVSRNNINFYGWIGCGYVITDPDTGAGGYMISGGSNGSWIKDNPKTTAVIGVASLCFIAFFFWPILVAIGAFTVLVAQGVLWAQLIAFIVGSISIALVASSFSDNFLEFLQNGISEFTYALLTGSLILSGFIGPVAAIILFLAWIVATDPSFRALIRPNTKFHVRNYGYAYNGKTT